MDTFSLTLGKSSTMSYLTVSGTKIVDKDGKEVVLCGAGLGGWMKYVIIDEVWK